tara:strand:- start:546 stop:2135 length:1590 start_codon:yes stop_codon:yes gene_type:complete
MNTKKIISEVAGISFEVRNWAKVIEKYVDDYVAKEKEKLKSQQPKEEPKSYTPSSYSWSYNDDSPGDDDDEFQTDYTHFENLGGEKSDIAYIYGSELYINGDVLEEYPNIKEKIQDKLFKIELDGKGQLSVDTVESNFPNTFLYGILEIVQDHLLMGKDFHDDTYNEVKAVIGGDNLGNDMSDYYDYMNEDNRWSNYGGYGGGYGGYSYTPQPKIDKIEINGKDFPEEYKDFKVDKWVITSSGRIEYDHWKSGYDKNGDYVVYLNMPMSSIGGSALVHEIKHAYDDWNRMSKGAPPIRDGWEIKNIYTPDFEKLVLGGGYKLSPMLNPIIRYYYLGSKLESPAYLENEYDNSGLGGDYRGTAKKMMNFKASSFLNKNGEPAKGLQESWTKLITEYDIPFFRKFKNVVDFLNYTEKHFNKRGRNIMKRIDKMRYVHDKPEPKYEPRVYTKPKELPKTGLNQLSLLDEPKNKNTDVLDKEIDVLEAKWDDVYEKYLTNKNPELRKELNSLEKLINEKIKKLNDLDNNNLPF